MKRISSGLASSGFMLFALPLTTAAAGPAPGLYEYTISMNMPGAPAPLPVQTSQRCLGPDDVDGNKAIEMPPPGGNSDCRMKDMARSGGQFSYKVSCTRPQALEGRVQGTVTDTSMRMDMTMSMAGTPGPMTQTIAARRVGDCKP